MPLLSGLVDGHFGQSVTDHAFDHGRNRRPGDTGPVGELRRRNAFGHLIQDEHDPQFAPRQMVVTGQHVVDGSPDLLSRLGHAKHG